MISVGIGLGGITASGRVAAQPPAAPSPAPTVADGGDDARSAAEARRRYQEGNAAMKSHQWQRAYEAYLAAWRQRPHWQVAGSLGEVELELGKNREAASHLALFLRDAKDVPPEEMKRVHAWLEQARARVATLTISTAPQGANLLLDGAAIGPAPVREELYVDPGKHVIEGRVGSCSAVEQVDVAAGQSKEILLRCELTAPVQKVAVAPPTGPLRPVAATAPEKPLRARQAILIAGGGVTVASLGLGVTSLALFTARGHAARVSHEPATGPDARAEARFKSVALWSFVAAGVVGGGTLVYALQTRHASPPRVKGGLVVGPTGAAAMLQGDF